MSHRTRNMVILGTIFIGYIAQPTVSKHGRP